jgi:hypothetical protein
MSPPNWKRGPAVTSAGGDAIDPRQIDLPGLDAPTPLHLAPVVNLPCVTSLDLSAARVLDAVPRDLAEVVVIGTDADGGFYFSSSIAGGPVVLWMLEIARRELMDAAAGA